MVIEPSICNPIDIVEIIYKLEQATILDGLELQQATRLGWRGLNKLFVLCEIYHFVDWRIGNWRD